MLACQQKIAEAPESRAGAVRNIYFTYQKKRCRALRRCVKGLLQRNADYRPIRDYSKVCGSSPSP